MFVRGHAGTMRNMAVAGWRPGEAIGSIWVMTVTFHTKDLWKAFWSRTYLFNAFDQTESSMDRWASVIRSSRIDYLYGYPSSVSEFARYVMRRRIELPLRAIFLTAEKYFPGERETIENAFHCKSYDFYGSSEVQNIAFECRR